MLELMLPEVCGLGVVFEVEAGRSKELSPKYAGCHGHNGLAHDGFHIYSSCNHNGRHNNDSGCLANLEDPVSAWAEFRANPKAMRVEWDRSANKGIPGSVNVCTDRRRFTCTDCRDDDVPS